MGRKSRRSTARLLRTQNPTRNLHFDRYMKIRSGASAEDLAREQGVKVDAIQASVALVERYRARNTVEFANETAIDALVATGEELKETLRGGLTATQTVETVDKKGRTRRRQIPDLAQRRDAAETWKGILSTVQPKAKGQAGPTVNVGIAMAGRAVGGEGHSGGGSFEDRIRELQKKRELALQSGDKDSREIIAADPGEGDGEDDVIEAAP